MPQEDIILNENDRKKLDGIVQKMQANKESDDDIQFVVNDFKTKYGVKKKVNTESSSLDTPSVSPSTENLEQPAPWGQINQTKVLPILTTYTKKEVAPPQKPIEEPTLGFGGTLSKDNKPQVLQKEEQPTNPLIPKENKTEVLNESAKVASSLTKAPDPELQSIGDAVKIVGKTALNTIADISTSFAVASKELNLFGEYDDKKITDLATYKWGDWLRKNADLLEVDPQSTNSLAGQMLGGGTSIAINLLGGISSKALKLGAATIPAAMGAMQNGGSEYRQAYETINDAQTLSDDEYYFKYGNGLPYDQVIANKQEQSKMDAEDTAFKMFLPASAIGTLDALPITSFLKKMDTATGGLVHKTMGNALRQFADKSIGHTALVQGLEEGIQETATQYLNNVAAIEIYDKTRSLYDNLTENGVVGFALGALLGGMGRALRQRRLDPNNTVAENVAIDKSIDLIDEKQAIADNIGSDEVVKPEDDSKAIADLKATKESIEVDLANPNINPNLKQQLQARVDQIDNQIAETKASEIADANNKVIAEGQIAQADADIEALKVQSEEATSPETKAIIDNQIAEQTAKKEELSTFVKETPIEVNTEATLANEVAIGEVKDAFTIAKKLSKNAKILNGGFGEKVANYTTESGIEVSLKDDDGGDVNGEQVQADFQLDYIGNEKGERGKGLASQELEKILAEADENNLSISLIIDSEGATTNPIGEKDGNVGLSDKELKKWYQGKGFIFDKNSRYGYRPKKSEDLSKYKTESYQAKENEIKIGENLENQSSPQDLQEAFSQGRLKENVFYEDGDNSIYVVKNGKLKLVDNVDYTYKYEKDNNGKVNLIEEVKLKEQPTKTEPTTEQVKAEQSDKLVAMRERYNALPKNSKKRGDLLMQINSLASKIGVTPTTNKKTGKLDIVKENGSPLKRSKQENTAKPLEERTPEFQSFYEKIKGDIKLKDTTIDNYKIDVGLSQKEINKAVDDIANGKHNLNTGRLLDGLEAMQQSGGIDFTQGDGLTVSKTSVPLDQYFDAKNQDIEDMYDDLSEEERDAIEEEIIKNTKEIGDTDWNAVQESFANKPQPNNTKENGQERVSTTDNTPSKEAERNESVKAEKGEGGTEREKAGESEDGSPRVSGIKKALVSEDVIDSVGIDRRSAEEMLAQGKEAVDSGAIDPENIVEEIVNNEARALQPIEVAALVYYKTQLDNKIADAYEKKVEAEQENNFMDAAAQEAKISQLEKRRADYEVMQVKTAYEQSLAFRLRRMLLDSEFNIQTLVAKYRAKNDGTMPADIRAKFEEDAKKLEELNQRIEKLEEEKRAFLEKEAFAKIQEEVAKNNSQKKTSIKDETKRIADKIRRGKTSRPSMFLSSNPAAIAWDGALEITATAIEVGGSLAQSIKNGIDHIKETDWYKGLSKGDKDAAESQFREYIYKKAKVETGATVVGDKVKIPHDLIKKYVEEGADTIDKLVAKIKSDLEENYPDITDRQIRDGITGYGNTIETKKGIYEEIRRIKRIGKLISGLEDVREKQQRPLRSGQQRDELSVEERMRMKELNAEMKKLPQSEDENAKAWKSALDAIKSRLKNSIEELERRIATGEKTPKKDSVPYDQEALELKAKKDALREQLEVLEGKQEMSDEQRVKLAVAGLERSIKNLEEKIDNKEFEAKAKTPKTPQTPQIVSLKQQLKDLQGQYKELQKEAGIPEKKRLENYKTRAKNQIKALEEKLAKGDFSKKEKTPPMDFDAEALKLEAEKIKIKERFEYEFEKLELSKRSSRKKAWDRFIEVIGLPKSLITTLDMSAPLRQGLMFTLPRLFTNPIKSAKAFGEMFKYAFNEKYYDDWLASVKASPNYPLIKNSKLYISSSDGKASAREEALISTLINKVPLLGALTKGSARAYTGYLNQMRVDVFNELSDNFISLGVNPKTKPKEFEALARYINNATGRGDLGSFETSATELAQAFFSPRLIAARIRAMNPAYYAKLPPAARRRALIETSKFAASLMMVAGLAYLYAKSDDDDDTTMDLDPRSSDFLKLKIGDTRVDFAGGFQQYIRVIWQTITGEKKSATTGKIEELGAKYGSTTRTENLINFFKNKMSPIPSLAWNLGETHLNKKGERVDQYGNVINYKEIARDLTIPLYASDLRDIYKQHGTGTATLLGLGSFFGLGVSNYEPKVKSKKPKEQQ